MDFLTALLNLISTNKSLKQIDIDVPRLSDLICTQIMAIVSVLINNTSLQMLTMCNGLYVFKRNTVTKEMEFTNFPNFANLPLKNIFGTDTLSPSTDASDGLSSSPPQAKQPCKYESDQECSRYDSRGHKQSPTLQNIAHHVPYPYPDLSSSSRILSQALKFQPQKQQLGIHSSVLIPTATTLIPTQGTSKKHYQYILQFKKDLFTTVNQSTATDLVLELDAPTSSMVVYDQLPSSLHQAQQPYKHQEWSCSSSHPRDHEQSHTITQYRPYPDLPFPFNVPLQTPPDQSQSQNLQSGTDSSPLVPQSLPTSVSSLSSSPVLQCHSAVTSTKPSNSPLTSGNFSQVHFPAATQQPVTAAKRSSAKEDSQSNISCPKGQAGISSNEQGREINTS